MLLHFLVVFVYVIVYENAFSLAEARKQKNSLACTNSYGSYVKEATFQKSPKNNTPFHIFIHVVIDANNNNNNKSWKSHFKDILLKLKRVEYWFTSLTISVVGLNITEDLRDVIEDAKVNVKSVEAIQTHINNEFGQYPTFRYMHRKANEVVTVNKQKVHFAYISLESADTMKEISKHGILKNRTLALSSEMLGYGYDIVGTLPKNDVLQQSRRDGIAKHNISEHWRYSGHFWLATAKFISTLTRINLEKTRRHSSPYYMLSQASINNNCAGIFTTIKNKDLGKLGGQGQLSSSNSYSGKLIQFYPVDGQAIQGHMYDDFYLLRNNRIHQIPDMDTYHMLNSSHDIFYGASEAILKYNLGVPITPYLKTYTNDDKVVNYLAQKTVTVSYVMYSPANSLNAIHIQCFQNLEFFLLHGIVGRTSSSSVSETHPNIQYIFTLVGNTLPTESLKAIARKYNNVEIINHHSVAVDLFPHGSVLRKYSASDFNVFLSCGSRGPYYQQDASLAPTVEWLYPFFDKMVDSDVKMIGPSINCQVAAHVQSFALFTDRVGADIIAPYWQENNKKKHDIVVESEVGISTAVLSKGYNIADMTGRFTNHDFRRTAKTGQGCEATNRFRHNPTYMVFVDSFISLHPCKGGFIKYGGHVLPDIPPLTFSRVHTIDNQKLSVGVCKQNINQFLSFDAI